MAHLENHTRKDMAKITKEAYREHREQRMYKNSVDLQRSHLNYSMAGIDRKEFLARLDARCNEVMQGRYMQTQTNVCGSWVHTCPEALCGDPDKERAYFEACFEFDRARYGEANVIDMVVHNDETTPHGCTYVVPACTSRKTQKPTISTASMFTRQDLRTYHKDLDVFLEKRFGQKGLALNGRTKGNYTLDELKERTRREKELADREAAVGRRERAVVQRERAIASRERAIEAREADLEAERVKLRRSYTTAVRKAERASEEAVARVRQKYEALRKDAMNKILDFEEDANARIEAMRGLSERQRAAAKVDLAEQRARRAASIPMPLDVFGDDRQREY